LAAPFVLNSLWLAAHRQTLPYGLGFACVLVLGVQSSFARFQPTTNQDDDGQSRDDGLEQKAREGNPDVGIARRSPGVQRRPAVRRAGVCHWKQAPRRDSARSHRSNGATRRSRDKVSFLFFCADCKQPSPKTPNETLFRSLAPQVVPTLRCPLVFFLSVTACSQVQP